MERTGLRARLSSKIAAIGAGVLVLGLGAAYTVASWNDSEWVWGGADGDPGIGTSAFEVRQNTTSPYLDAVANWDDQETNPGAELTVSPGALALTPGDTVYAPVSLRTTVASVAGEVGLQGAVPAAGVVPADAGGALWNAIRVSVYTAVGATPPSACTTGFNATGWTQIVTNAGFATAGSTEQQLAATGGSTQHYCFAITLPAGSPDTLQGRTVAPAWEFAAESL